MKKLWTKLGAIFTLSFLVLSAPSQALAQAAGGGATDSILNDIEDAIGLSLPSGGGRPTIGAIITSLLPYLFTFGGMILFGMLIWGGFEMLAGASETKAQEAGKQRITAAVIGFILLFASYWMAQLMEIIFGIKILG